MNAPLRRAPLRLGWTRREDAIVRRLYPKAGVPDVVGALPGRTWSAIRRRASVLGIARVDARAPWSPAEVASLRRLYPSAPWPEILRALPRRARGSICQMAGELGVRRVAYRNGGGTSRVWTRAQDAELREMWPQHARRSICERLGRRWTAVRARAVELGLTGDGSRRWSGYVSLTEAARRAGYARGSFVALLRAYQRHFKTIPAGPGRDALPSPAVVARGRAGRGSHRVVDAQAAVDAVEWRVRQETAREAAARLGVRYADLVGAAREGRAGHAKWQRHGPEWWDVVARSIRAPNGGRP